MTVPRDTKAPINVLMKHHMDRSPASPDPPRYGGALLSELTKVNEKFLAYRLLRSQIHRKQPMGRPMPRRTAQANARKSAVRAVVEHVLARQKGPMGLFICTNGSPVRQSKSVLP